MARLENSLLEKMSSVLLQVYALREPESIPVAFANALASIVPCANASYNRLDPKLASVAVARSRGIRVPTEEEAPLVRYLHQHPCIPRLLESEPGPVLQFSDFLSRRQYHALDLYNEYYRRSDTQQQMAFKVGNLGRHCIIMAVNHVSGSSFSEADRQVATLMQPHLANALRAVRSFTNWRDLGAGLQEIVDRANISSVLLSREGRVLYASPLAEELFEDYFPHEPPGLDGLPDTVAAWARVHARRFAEKILISQAPEPLLAASTRGHLRIDFRFSDEGRLPLLLLTEDPSQAQSIEALENHGLTRREAEVLAWLPMGKTNDEIAQLLEISPRTVHKHLENIYRKLGLEHRVAAAQFASHHARR